MKWQKLGRIYVPDGTLAWAKKYACPPTPLLMPNGVLRLYTGFCDENTVGRAGYVEVDPADPTKVLNVTAEPVLDIGVPGAFDENGVLPTSVIRVGDEIFMYYVGYQLGYKVRYFQFEGLAISRDGGATFSRYSQVPVIDRSDDEMHNRTSAFVDGRRRPLPHVVCRRQRMAHGERQGDADLRHALSQICRPARIERPGPPLPRLATARGICARPPVGDQGPGPLSHVLFGPLARQGLPDRLRRNPPMVCAGSGWTIRSASTSHRAAGIRR